MFNQPYLAANVVDRQGEVQVLGETKIIADERTNSLLVFASVTDMETIKDIPALYPIGSEILVQITKSTIGSKGPRTTTNIALPGRFLVLMPFGGQCGVSRKIESDKERKRLKEILKRLSIPEGMGVVMRTVK